MGGLGTPSELVHAFDAPRAPPRTLTSQMLKDETVSAYTVGRPSQWSLDTQASYARVKRPLERSLDRVRSTLLAHRLTSSLRPRTGRVPETFLSRVTQNIDRNHPFFCHRPKLHAFSALFFQSNSSQNRDPDRSCSSVHR